MTDTRHTQSRVWTVVIASMMLAVSGCSTETPKGAEMDPSTASMPPSGLPLPTLRRGFNRFVCPKAVLSRLAAATVDAVTPSAQIRALDVLPAQIALWLGHESIQTTEEYLRVDVTQRISVLTAVTPPQLRPGKFRPPDALIASLTG